ncbi:MAG: hypothetical protein GY811_06760 [Myxococcales bacterium]|nr:hypothetical protein [Myxococcales bacterium]
MGAETSLGPVKLSLGPRSTRLSVGPQVWTIADDHLMVATPAKGKRKAKRRSIRLGDSRLYVARAWPTNEVSLWLERKPGVVQRMLGLPPMTGMHEETIKAWRDLERLATRLQDALIDYGAGARAFEVGNGQHRVFALRYPAKLVVYARKVFREKPRRIVEVREDGALALPGWHKDRIIPMDRGMEVIASGDRINFCHPDGEHAAGIFLPWIGDADRVELTRRFQALIRDSGR